MRDKQEKPILGDHILHSRPPGYWTVKYVVCAIHNYTTTVTDLIQYTYYRNSLYFRCKNIIVHRKRTKIFYANIRKFFRLHTTVTSTSRIAAAHISLYTW